MTIGSAEVRSGNLPVKQECLVNFNCDQYSNERVFHEYHKTVLYKLQLCTFKIKMMSHEVICRLLVKLLTSLYI